MQQALKDIANDILISTLRSDYSGTFACENIILRLQHNESFYF